MTYLAVTPELSSFAVGGLTTEVCNEDFALPQKAFQDRELQQTAHSSEKITFP
jgi:hypothetical protein